MNGISMLILSVGSIIAVLFFVTYAAQKHDLNGIKDKTVGNGQHGTARWATRQEVKRTYHHVPYTPNQWRQAAKEGKQPTANEKPLPQGIVLGCQGSRKTAALVDSDDVHVLMIGASGVGKTAYFLYPNLEYACASGMSFLALDTKGDLARNYGAIARDIYNYRISVVDLREPTRSDGNNLLTLINRYMGDHRENPTEITAKAKAEKYAKILAKTIISPEGEGSDHGQNAYFYDAAEGLLASVVLLLSEFLPPEETDGYETRHIASVFKLVQELLMQGRRGGNQFQELMQLLPSEHKAKWLAGSALTASDQAMNSIMSTVLSRLNAFLDTELEQVLCFDGGIDAEQFVREKCAIFLILPEEDLSPTRTGENNMHDFTKLYRMDLPHRAISVYIYLADRANKDGICWPSIPTISKDLKLSESTVRRALNDLRTVGAVKTRQRYRENGGYTSLLFALKDSR